MDEALEGSEQREEITEEEAAKREAEEARAEMFQRVRELRGGGA